MSLEEAVEQVGGLQTQQARSGYIGLWSRLTRLRRSDYTAALNERRLVQGWLMRVTIHTVSAADYWPMAVAVRRPRRAWWMRAWGKRMGLTDADMRRAASAVRSQLAEGPLRQRVLVARMAERGFLRDVTIGAGLWVDLVRVPPQGTWERPRADLYGLAEDWLPPTAVGEGEARDLLLRRYLAAYGPAAVADMSGWTGLSVAELRPMVERAEVRRFRDAEGRELLDLPDAALPDPDTPAPARFIGSFDAMLLIQARRTHVLPEEFRSRVYNTGAPQSFHTFLLDGQVAGSWRPVDGRVEVTPFRTLTPTERRELEEEAHRLERFLAD
ncbi:MAG TPA: winged helix DNA-binding domain-containing protein [Candidatus Limnocylindria bacterium]|nr:winged helix DNA-binding domain-containing protein [Candidatus Limnocylindria bacterium]